LNFFTADLHLGHEAIIVHAKRPFANAAEMNRAIIRNINAACSSDDDLYVIGDFSLASARQRGAYQEWLAKIKPRVHLIAGNHDVLHRLNFLAGDVGVGFFSVHYPYLEVAGFVCLHDPALALAVPNRTVLCGHVHTMWRHCKNAINVGVDVWDFKPVSTEQIENYIAINQ